MLFSCFSIYLPIFTIYANYLNVFILIKCVLGIKNLKRDLKFMLKFQPGFYWRFTWVFCAPVILSVSILQIFSFK